MFVCLLACECLCACCDYMWKFVFFFFFLLPCQHSEHKGRGKQRERDASNPGPLLLTAIVQRNSIMCANNVIIRYLEHNSVCKSISLHKCIISYSNEMFAKTTILGCCFFFMGICKGLNWWFRILPQTFNTTAEYGWVGSQWGIFFDAPTAAVMNSMKLLS